MTKADCLALIEAARTAYMGRPCSDFLDGFWRRQEAFYRGLLPLLED